ncbi:unnamed protein product [Anisakis simplex]|uniref:Uncharacterized protein n=1 Tax=Anisakis simplex TaxID=6269 RepID=A0A0M3JGI1_ANISI|nr:unnamed protein product [Anisakis simplex]
MSSHLSNHPLCFTTVSVYSTDKIRYYRERKKSRGQEKSGTIFSGRESGKAGRLEKKWETATKMKIWRRDPRNAPISAPH